MWKRIFFWMLVVSTMPLLAQTQKNNDPALFTVANTPVHVSEFKYIYSKTNGQNADYSKSQ